MTKTGRATQTDVEDIIEIATRMARRMGYDFVANPEKIKRFEAYQQALEEIATGLNGRMDRNSLAAKTAYAALYPDG